MSAASKTSQSQPPKSSLPRKPRAPRRPRRGLASSDEEDLRRVHSSDSEDNSASSDVDTLSSSEDALDTPAPPATSTDHSVSPPSTRRSKKRTATKPEPSLIPPQPTSWSELVGQEDDLHSSEPPILDFADFVSGGVAGLDTAGPSHSGPEQEGGKPEPASGRGRSKPRGGKTQRQAYLERLSEDPSFTPRVGTFWGHDERLLAPELRGMSDWWRGRWNGRGRGMRGRGTGRWPNGTNAERPVNEDAPEAAPSPPPIERTWGHDGFEKMKDQERARTQATQARGSVRGRVRGRGRGGRGGVPSREPEQLWTKAPDTHLHIDPSTRPQFPGQGRGIKVNLPGQWRPTIVRVGRNSKPAPAQPSPKLAVEEPAEIVVKLPGKDAKVVAVSSSGPTVPAKPATPEDPETIQPLQDATPKVVARLPGANVGAAGTMPSVPPPPPTTAPKPPPAEFLPRPAPTSALSAQVLNQAPASAAPKPTPPTHGRTRSQFDAVAFARPPAVPPTDSSIPLAFGSLELPVLVPGSAPPPDTTNMSASPTVNPPASAPLPSRDTPPAPPPLNIPGPASVRPPPPPMASYTPPPGPGGYYNPYAYTPLDGATYYSTATPPPHHPGMYYPANGFFVPPRPSGPVSIRAPGEGPNMNVGMNGDEGAPRPPVPPMWNYYHHPHPHPHHSHSHSHSHGHNSYYSPSGTPYPPPPAPHQPGYYPGTGEYGGAYDYTGGGVYY